MAGYLEAGRPRFGTVVRAGVVVVLLLAVFAYWPFRSVPTGNRAFAIAQRALDEAREEGITPSS